MHTVKCTLGHISEPRPKSSKREVVADVKGDVRIFACLQDLDNGEWNLIDLIVENTGDGSFRKTSVFMRRYPCERMNLSEAPDWVVSGGVGVVAGISESKVWTLGSKNFHVISQWPTKNKIDDTVPNVSRVALSPNTAYMCTSNAATINVHRMAEIG